jgi:hypothetical protein
VPPIHPSLRMEATGTFGSLQNTTNISFVIIEYVENSRTRLVGVAVGTLRDGAKARLQQGFGELLWHLLLPSMRWVGCSMHPWPPHISQKSWAHMDASLYYRAAALLSSYENSLRLLPRGRTSSSAASGAPHRRQLRSSPGSHGTAHPWRMWPSSSSPSPVRLHHWNLLPRLQQA